MTNELSDHIKKLPLKIYGFTSGNVVIGIQIDDNSLSNPMLMNSDADVIKFSSIAGACSIDINYDHVEFETEVIPFHVRRAYELTRTKWNATLETTD